MQTEQSIVDRINGGDLSAFKQLVMQHERLVTHMVARIINNDENVKDVSQDVFIKVYKNIGRFNFNSKLSTWIARIAYTTAINYVKKYPGRNEIEIDEGITDIQLISHETPEDILTAKEESIFLQNQISKLPTSYKTVLTLYHLNEFSYQEIEEITGMPEGTVKNYLFRARQLLKQRLERYYKKAL